MSKCYDPTNRPSPGVPQDTGARCQTMTRERSLHHCTATRSSDKSAHNITKDVNGRDSNVPKVTDTAELVHVKVLRQQKTASFWVAIISFHFNSF